MLDEEAWNVYQTYKAVRQTVVVLGGVCAALGYRQPQLLKIACVAVVAPLVWYVSVALDAFVWAILGEF